MPESEKPDAPTLLVVDDEVAVRRSLGRLLSRQGFSVIEAGTLDDALAATAEHDVHVALVDCPLKGTEGTAAVQAIHSASNTTEIVALTAMGSSETSFHVMRSGACDYYEKPISDWHRFFQVINKALEVRNLKAEKIRLSKLRSGEAIEQLIGNSPAMRDLEALIRQVAPTPVPVLIMGESGSGKERVARAVHAASSCKHGPWVAINCAAIPADLLESELFGYEKGGHSQADQRKKGLFELANEGTIFLDEIGEMPMTMQAKLLRVLQEREVQRIGGTSPIAINCRVLAATNRDLRQAIVEKHSEKICFIASGSSKSACPHFASAAKTFRCCPTTFSTNTERSSQKASADCTPPPSPCSRRWIGPEATYGSWSTQSSAPWCSAKPMNSRRICLKTAPATWSISHLPTASERTRHPMRSATA
jgi:DNA-binding NtrC family response regulator